VIALLLLWAVLSVPAAILVGRFISRHRHVEPWTRNDPRLLEAMAEDVTEAAYEIVRRDLEALSKLCDGDGARVELQFTATLDADRVRALACRAGVKLPIVEVE
jgi:hypothetical protein